MSQHDDLLVARGTSLAEPMAINEFRKAPPPNLGDKYGAWNADYSTYRYPGGSVLTFDLSRLTLDDFRMMRGDYQINASLLILLGMIAQSDWSIYTKGQENKDPAAIKISDTLEDGIRRYWMPLVRSYFASLWAGFSPTVLVYDLNPQSQYLEVVTYKDLIPDDCRVNWNTTYLPDGNAIRKYDGIVNNGRIIPAENTLWSSLLMENGNYYGTKLLKPAFAPWFFSQLIHLYTNRYFERFGEPTAVGYYPDDESVTAADGSKTTAREAMQSVLTNLRSRGVISMPSDRDPDNGNLEWEVKYLESQMRGADFDRYLHRLDEEKSLALFTPVLLFRAGERGSYALGTIHERVFQWMLNMLLNDWKFYLDRYLIQPLHDVNFGPNAPRSEIRFRTMGRLTDQGAFSTLQALIQNGAAKVSEEGLTDLGDYLGVDLEYLTAPAATPGTPPGDGSATGDPSQPDMMPSQRGMPTQATRQLVLARNRLVEQVTNIFHRKDGWERERALQKVRLGYKSAFVNYAQRPDAEQWFNTFEEVIRDAICSADTEHDAAEAVSNVYRRWRIAE